MLAMHLCWIGLCLNGNWVLCLWSLRLHVMQESNNFQFWKKFTSQNNVIENLNRGEIWGCTQFTFFSCHLLVYFHSTDSNVNGNSEETKLFSASFKNKLMPCLIALWPIGTRLLQNIATKLLIIIMSARNKVTVTFGLHLRTGKLNSLRWPWVLKVQAMTNVGQMCLSN